MKRLVVVLFASVLLAGASYPSKPVKIIVPFPAGGTNDVLTRVVAERLRVAWGQPVLVETRAGAGGNIGADVVARAEPDGYHAPVRATPAARDQPQPLPEADL